mmetsp:Transcript_3522/g.5538  ORF Transcript_3522/g.5538 Transcript_3522/m.5538 type:complete len:193 (+) Transcript_3522:1012-1590(+)
MITLEKKRIAFRQKIRPKLRYRKRIGRRIRDLVTRVDQIRKKRAQDFNIRVLFDSKPTVGSSSSSSSSSSFHISLGTTVIDLNFTNFYAGRPTEKIGVVGVSKLAMRHPFIVEESLLTATKEGLLIWSGNDSSGSERLFICGKKGIGSYAWADGKLYTVQKNTIFVWDAPLALIVEPPPSLQRKEKENTEKK